MNRITQLLEQRKAQLAEWNAAAEAGDEAKASAAEAAVAKTDADLASARAMQAKLDEATRKGAETAAEIAQPVKAPVLESTRSVTGGESRARFSSLAHQCREVRHLAVAGVPVRDGVIEMQRKYESRAAQGAGEATAEQGGLLLQEDIVNELMPIVLSDGGLPGRCQQRLIGGNRLLLNRIKNYTQTTSWTGAATAYWVDEGSAPTASIPAFERISMELRKVAALVYASDELLEDAPQFAAELNNNVGLELQLALGEAILNGTGGAQPLGIIGNAPTISISAEAGQAAQTLVFENVLKMRARHLDLGGSPVWLYNKGLETQFPLLNAAVGVGGGLVFMPPGGISASPYATLFGYPLVPCQHCQARGTVGDLVLIDPSAIVLGMKAGGVKSAVSIHVAFTTAESCFRFSMRVQSAPRISTAVTPNHAVSGETLSPFVTLATRA